MSVECHTDERQTPRNVWADQAKRRCDSLPARPVPPSGERRRPQFSDAPAPGAPRGAVAPPAGGAADPREPTARPVLAAPTGTCCAVAAVAAVAAGTADDVVSRR